MPGDPVFLHRRMDAVRRATKRLTKEAWLALPNVTLHPSYPDMRAGQHSLKLLVPSIYEETYGRVVTQAQVNGIPALASSRGGLPESVGEGA